MQASMMAADDSIKLRMIDPPVSKYVSKSRADAADYSRKQLYSRKTCAALAKSLAPEIGKGNLEFYIQDSRVVLPPESYLY